jgi:hypothetical protein
LQVCLTCAVNQMKALPPSQRLYKNLLILVAARRALFTYEGLSPYLLCTKMYFVKEYNRIPVTKLVLPFVSDTNNRTIMSKVIEAQEKQNEWGRPEQNEPVWIFFRRAQIIPTPSQQIDDLMQLDYSRLLEDLDVPDKANINLFWGGLTDFLVNSWSVLEELRLASLLSSTRDKEAQDSAKQENDPKFTKLIGWHDMQFEHHLLNTIFRIRAGWDKLIDYVIVPYYGLPNLSKNRWPTRLNRLEKELRNQLNLEQTHFLDNLMENAQAIAHQGGLRDTRDFELHKIAVRSRETLGNRHRAPSLQQLELFAVAEHYRLQDNFVLCLGIILGGPQIN